MKIISIVTYMILHTFYFHVCIFLVRITTRAYHNKSHIFESAHFLTLCTVRCSIRKGGYHTCTHCTIGVIIKKSKATMMVTEKINYVHTTKADMSSDIRWS